MSRKLVHPIAVVAFLSVTPQVRGQTLYAAFTGIYNFTGITEFNANTLQSGNTIETSTEPSAVSVFGGNLYDVEGNTICRRNQTTGAVLAQNSGLTGITGMGKKGSNLVVLTDNSNTPTYVTLNPQTLVQITSNMLSLVGETGPTYMGSLAYPTVYDLGDPNFPNYVASTGKSLITSSTISIGSPGSKLVSTQGPDDSPTVGTLGQTAYGNGYYWSAFNGPIGTGFFASDANLNPIVTSFVFTSAAIGGLAFQNSDLYYSASNIIYRRDPLTGTTLAQSAPEAAVFGDLAVQADLLGDFNFDGHVDASDIEAMEQALANLPAYQAANGLTAAQLLAIGDINGDGVVNNADLQALITYLKNGGGSADSVPEPASWVMALLSLAMISGTRFCVRCFR